SVFDATLALLGALREPREAGAPAGVVADVAAQVREQRDSIEAVLLQPRRREAVAVADLGAELEEQVGRREPLHLQSVLPVLAAEHGLIHQWLVDEVPGVRVYFVEIAEA